MLTHRTQVDDRAVSWVERPAYGTSGRVPLLVVPGLGMTWRAFRWLLADLPYDRRVVVVHPPGSPGSDVIDDMTAQGQADHVGRWVDRAGPTEFDLLGHSFGAFVAARLAATRPHAARALTLVSPAPDGRWTTLPRHLAAFCAGSVREDWHTAPQAVADYLRADRRVLRGFRLALGTTASDLMAGVDAPTVVVRGTDDRVSSAAWCDALAAACPRGRTAVIHRAAHGLPQDVPHSLARLLSAAATRSAAG